MLDDEHITNTRLYKKTIEMLKIIIVILSYTYIVLFPNPKTLEIQNYKIQIRLKNNHTSTRKSYGLNENNIRRESPEA